MLSIVFNFLNSDLHQKVEAIALKAGYLLSSEIYTAGSTCHEMYIKENCSGLSMFQKIDMLERMYRNSPEHIENIRIMKALMKLSNSITYKTSQQLAKDKEGKNIVHKLWSSSLDLYQAAIDCYGFRELKELAKDKEFNFYPINNDPENFSDDRLRASDLLQRLLLSDDEEEENAEPEIFFLGSEFLSDAYSKPHLYKVTDKEAENKDNIYLHRCFTLPDINVLTTGELQMAHQYIKQAGSLFRQRSDDWINMCYDDEDVTKRMTFFKNEVLKTAADLQQSISKKGTLTTTDCKTCKELTIEVWMGEIPVLQLWNYYKHYNAVKESTWHKLMAVKDTFSNQRWPVIMLYIPEEKVQQLLNDENDFFHQLTQGVNDDEEEIKASRKYISIE